MIITVDQSGRGDYSTVQAAVDAVPEFHDTPVIIEIGKGVYREKIYGP